jgi:hypothetical protein
MKANHRSLLVALAVALATTLGTDVLAQEKGKHHHHGSAHEQGEHQGCPHGSCMHGAHGDEGECPMLSARGAEVKVENTKDGALIRLVTKDPARVAGLQKAAASIAEHMAAHAATPASAATPSGKP